MTANAESVSAIAGLLAFVRRPAPIGSLGLLRSNPDTRLPQVGRLKRIGRSPWRQVKPTSLRYLSTNMFCDFMLRAMKDARN